MSLQVLLSGAQTGSHGQPLTCHSNQCPAVVNAVDSKWRPAAAPLRFRDRITLCKSFPALCKLKDPFTD